MPKQPSCVARVAYAEHAAHAARVLPALLILAALAPERAIAQTSYDCQAVYGQGTFALGAWASSSNWLQLATDASPVRALKVTLDAGSGSGHRLQLASNWSQAAVTQTFDLDSTSPRTFGVESRAGALIGFVTHPSGSPGMTATVTLCRDGVAPPPPPPPPPPQPAKRTATEQKSKCTGFN